MPRMLSDDMPSRPPWEEFDQPGMERPPSEPEQRIKPDYIPVTDLSTLDIAEELLVQLNAAKLMLHNATYDDSIPLNQKAQAVNSITTILQNIAKTQTDIYNAERTKKLESLLIETLKEFPTLKNDFMTRFEEVLEANDA